MLNERLGYHVIRRVARPESPFAGVLARDERGGVALLAPVGGADGWPRQHLRYASEHTLAPIDVVANTAGRAAEVVLPWCNERVDAFLVRRRRAGQPLTAGEAVTLGVCVLRGADDLIEPGGGVGSWWLTAQGRPVFAREVDAPGQGSQGAAGGAHIAVLHALAQACRDRGIESAIAACTGLLSDALGSTDRDRAPGLWHARVTAALAEGEEHLFALAGPEPLDASSLRPRTSRSLGGTFDALLDGPGQLGRPGEQAEPAAFVEVRADASRRRPWGFITEQVRQASARHIDPEIADVAVETWRRTSGSAGRVLRRPVVVAALLVALIVGAGVLWPVGVDAGDAEVDVAVDVTAVPTVVDEGAEAPGAGPLPEKPAEAGASDTVGASGLAGIAERLLVARAACQDAAECVRAVFEDEAAAQRVGEVGPDRSAPRPIDAVPQAREVVRIDDLGGVAVAKVSLAGDSEGAVPSEMLIIVQTERGWRIRDVFHVLDAPPAGEREERS